MFEIIEYQLIVLMCSKKDHGNPRFNALKKQIP